ncbi:M56 family metallopeptidase [Mariprofundus sp. NF]|uniref:M56 family metallopeptidase n=1 Tax=Mariprofundus sp. NF TaxID=2608716 RepID=UPI00159FEB1B|nr:M56 family metallopeptidase [Mariprofundus sp. NF]NWF37973.1 M56 family metallopeptidase [Mariprofundus sp. NF]
MSNYVGVLQLGLFASIGFAVLVAVVSAVIYPFARQRLAKLPPQLRSNILLGWLVAPAFIGGVLSLLSFMPSLISLFGFVPDHCSVHDGHLHLCLIHPPLPVDSSILQFFLVTLVGVTIYFIGISIFDLLRAHKFQRTLMAASYPHETYPIRIVDWDMPLALSAGIRRMRVFISSQLVETLSPKQLEVVIAHEQAHLSRRDPLRHFIAHAFSFAHIPWLRKGLLMDFDLATEQTCDDLAATKTGGRLHVADTILAVERLFIMRRLPSMVMSISGSNITARVESLLAQPPVYRSVSRSYMNILGIGVMIGAFAIMNDLHHFTESILQLMTGHM